MTKDTECLIALGSNEPRDAIGPEEILSASLQRISHAGLVLKRISRFYATPCFPAGAGPDYVNACAAVTGAESPYHILSLLHEIEAGFGRTRRIRWESRSLDLDLLAMRDIVLPNSVEQDRWRALPAEEQRISAPEELILPHPRIAERAFVLVPLNDIAPGWIHPRTGQSVRQMLAALPAGEREGVTPL